MATSWKEVFWFHTLATCALHFSSLHWSGNVWPPIASLNNLKTLKLLGRQGVVKGWLCKTLNYLSWSVTTVELFSSMGSSIHEGANTWSLKSMLFTPDFRAQLILEQIFIHNSGILFPCHVMFFTKINPFQSQKRVSTSFPAYGWMQNFLF